MNAQLQLALMIAAAAIGGCSDDGRLVATETRLTPNATQIECELDAVGYFNRLCFRLPADARVDVGTSRVIVDNQPIELFANLISEQGDKVGLAGLSALIRREGEFACLVAPELVQGREYVGIEARASHDIGMREIRWFSTDKM